MIKSLRQRAYSPLNLHLGTSVMIYLDNAASTPLHESISEASLFGNAGSRTHPIGLNLKSAVERSRENCAQLIGVKPEQLIFTSGATESLMLLIQGLRRNGSTNWGVVETEHKAALNQVLDVAPNATRLKVNRNGIVQLEDTIAAGVGVSMSVNNETGVVNEVWKTMKSGGANFTIADCTQSIGKLDFDLVDSEIDYMVGSAHKFHGPAGCGFIAVRDIDLWDELKSPSIGGGQERGVRSGTLNAGSIIQTGQVAKWLIENREAYQSHLRSIQAQFEAKASKIEGAEILGSLVRRAPHITSLYIPGVDSEALIAAVNQKIAISTGSACTSHSVEPSHVLLAMDPDIEKAESTIRVSYGWQNTLDEVNEAAEVIATAVREIQSFFQ